MTAELIGQLAEELREPLDSIRATIRSAGAPPGANLQSAIAHCDQLEQKLSKRVSLQPAPPPALPVWRRKVAIVDIRAAVDAALSRFESPPAVDVLWDGADDPHAVVFADAELISRTLLYLIGQSIQATPRGGCVLVRVQSLQSREAIRWSVIDQGRGFQRAELEQRLATEASNQGAFGLNACRRVAALHHGALELYSRVDSGTEISFETSHFGPREFASNWTAWRLAQRGKEGQRISSTQLAPQDSDQQLRIDAAPARLSLLRAEGSPQYPGCVSIGTVALGATVSLSAANQFDRVLQHQLDVFDFAYRAGPRRWVWGLDADQPAAHYRTDSIDQTVCATLEGIRTTWAEARI